MPSLDRSEAPSLLALALIALLSTGCVDVEDRSQSVGRMHIAFQDTERSDWAGKGPRPLAATVWYPAAAGSQESEWRVGPFRFGHSALDAGMASGPPRPLVLLSHGTGGSAAQLSWLAERLVVEGFIVAGVNHHGNTAAEPRRWPAGFLLPGERVRDLSLLLDRLLEHDVLGPHIDGGRIGAAGFSLGGYTVLALTGGAFFAFADWQRRCPPESSNPACRLPPEADFSLIDASRMAETDAAFREGIRRSGEGLPDTRIGAVYAIAPALITLLDEEHPKARPLPTRVVLAEADEQVLPEATGVALRRWFPHAEVLRLPAAGHYAFLAPCIPWRSLFMLVCRDPRGVDRRALHDQVGADAAAFFEEALQPAQH